MHESDAGASIPLQKPNKNTIMRGVVVCGEEVLAARLQQGLTQVDLAKLANLDVKTVRKAEQGKRLDLLPLSRLAGALKADVKRFIVPDDADAGLQARQRTTLMKWIAAFDAFDGDAIMTVFHEDAVMQIAGEPNIPFSGTFRGREEIRRSHEQAWSTRRQEPTDPNEVTIHAGDSVITVLGEKAVYLPNGELVRMPTVMIFTFVDDLISHLEVQFDTLDYARRMNLI